MAQGLRLLLLKDRPQMALVAQEKMSTLEEFQASNLYKRMVTRSTEDPGLVL